jgi:hypothetical protein
VLLGRILFGRLEGSASRGGGDVYNVMRDEVGGHMGVNTTRPSRMANWVLI